MAESADLLEKMNGSQTTLKYPPKRMRIPSKARNETNVRICDGSCEIKKSDR
jgi:hypothetical protein